MAQKPQPQQGFFLPLDLWGETIELFDELTQKRVKKITRAYESLSQITVTPKAEGEPAPKPAEAPSAPVDGASSSAPVSAPTIVPPAPKDAAG